MSRTYPGICNIVKNIINSGGSRPDESTALDELAEPVYWKNNQGLLMGCNESFAQLCGMKKADIIGKSDYDFDFTQTDIKLARREDNYVLTNRQPLTDLLRFKLGDWTLVSKFPVQDKHGKAYIVAIARDISGDRLYQRYDILQYLKERHFLGEVVAYSGYVAFVFRLEPSLPVQYISENVESLGIKLTDIFPGKTSFMDFVHWDDRRELYNSMVENGKTMGQFNTSFRLMGSGEGSIQVNCAARVNLIKSTMTTIVQGTLTTSANEYSNETACLNDWMSCFNPSSASEDVIKYIMDRDASIINIVDMDTYELIYSNEKRKRFLEKKLAGETLCYKLLYENRDSPCGHCPMSIVNTTKSSPSKPLTIEFYDHTDNKWYKSSAYPLRWVDGRAALFMQKQDVTQSKRNKILLNDNSFMDPMLNLPNRRKLEEILPVEIGSCSKNAKVALVALNIDDFGKLNFAYGFDEGNVLLKLVAEYLYEAPFPRKLVFRTSGDEFVVLLNALSIESIKHFVDTLFERFEQPWRTGSHDITCSASFGVSVYPDTSKTATRLQRDTMTALKDAKTEGKHRVSYFERQMAAKLEYTLMLEQRLRKAIEKDCEGFQVYYQPQIDAKSGKCTGVEALTRWVDENGNMVMPSIFIPMAETLDLIQRLDLWVLRTAVVELEQSGFFDDGSFSLSVNMSAMMLGQADLADSLEGVLLDMDMEPNQLVIEVTESVAIDDMKRASSKLLELRKLGVKIAMDDFGTGFSSLYNMKNMPIDCLKIDQLFVNELTSDEFSQAFIGTISELAHIKGIYVCAEGVETEAQKKLLIKNKSDLLQGYLFGKPMPIEDLSIRHRQTRGLHRLPRTGND